MNAVANVVALEKVCTRCGETLPVSEFFNDKRRPGRLRSTCRVCARTYYKGWYNKNPEKVAGYERRKMAIAKASPSPPDQYAVLQCSECGAAKDAQQFAPSPRRRRGREFWCRQCLATYHRRWKLKAYYGLTRQEYRLLLEGQGHACAICRSALDDSKRRASIDHDHQTGARRGILCCNCNTGIGMFRDNPFALEAAASYLRRHGK